MSLDLLEVAAEALGPLVLEVAFLGVTGYREYAELGDRLRARGFEEDTTSGVICHPGSRARVSRRDEGRSIS